MIPVLSNLWSTALAVALGVGGVAVEVPTVPEDLGSTETVFEVEHEDAFFELPLGPIARRSRPIAMTSHTLTQVRAYLGLVRRRQLKVSGAVSVAEIHGFYTRWLEAHGYEQLLDAPGDSPMAPGGTSWALRAYGELPTEIATELSGTFDKSRRRYIVAEKSEVGEHRVVAILLNLRRADEVRVQLDTVLVDAQATADLRPTQDRIYELLSRDGSAPLPGVRYVGMKTNPCDSAAGILDEVALLLASHPELRLRVVDRGRVGDRPDASAALGRARAQALVDLLIFEHGVTADRVTADVDQGETNSAETADAAGGVVLISLR